MKRLGITVIAWKPRDFKFPEDKIGRANEASLIISMGVVYLPKYANWVSDYVTEHAEFTDEKDSIGHDDQVDGTTMGISVWREKGGGAMAMYIRN